ncbi:hypothetical protein HNR60_004143 [Rhodopseudomonas rhenobacensis]|uniref:Uncharacterized protein n=1 Tax=Rhodopseudomonas rhenobacensis TaxID=87461 RepID=A0A7W7Z7C2_9BRAD|nr:hypothetical protein [Rhodopseudomonas rhenobacensis]MBB5049366.1 hypothetical protein [Rhodopseudomonas rhenobacensis]
MSQIRPLADADIAAVAGLFQRIFRDGRKPPSPALTAYLRQYYLASPLCESDIPSLVHVNDGGVSGFIGVNVVPMSYHGRKLRAAICSTMMVEHHGSDPMAGARLLKSLLAGPQDLSISETASAVSVQMWTRLRGIALTQYSLDWFRMIRPASFLLDFAATRIGAQRLLAPLARGIDALYLRRITGDEPRWSGVPAGWQPKRGLQVSEIDAAGFAALVEPLTAQFALRPDWRGDQLGYILSEAANKADQGDAVFAAVTTSSGAPVGAFLYHVRSGQIARVIQVLAKPGQAGVVLDCLIGDATARGAAGLRGRTQPALLDEMLSRRIAFAHGGATVVHSRDDALVEAFRRSQGFANGLVGEHWSRLIGGRFD